MSGAGIFIVFVVLLLVAARLLLRCETRPPVPSPDDAVVGSKAPDLRRGVIRRSER